MSDPLRFVLFVADLTRLRIAAQTTRRQRTSRTVLLGYFVTKLDSMVTVFDSTCLVLISQRLAGRAAVLVRLLVINKSVFVELGRPSRTG